VTAQPKSAPNFWDAQSPEVQLLLACSRTAVDQTWSAHIDRLATPDLDWERVLYLAGGHGVVPLLHRHLNALGPSAVPDEVRQKLRDEVHRIAGRNVVLATELLGLVETFERHSIVSMPYKGPALACQVYGDLKLRSFIDLDLLIHQKDVPQARKILIERGYEPQLKMTAAKERAILRSECDESFTRDNGRLLLELHWAITPPFFSFPLKTETLFERAGTIELLGRRVAAPAIEDLLLILCVNGTKDMWPRLEFICRVSELVMRYSELDWKQTFARAQELGAERMLLLGLFLVQEVLGTKLPEHVTKKFRGESALKRLSKAVGELLFERTSDVLSQFELTVFRLRSREHLRDRINYCFRRALSPTYQDLETVSLPPALEFLYPLIRPFRLIRR